MPTGTGFPAMNFRVEIDGITASDFLSVTGIEAEVTVIEYRSGNDKSLGTQKIPGEAKFGNILLKRGATSDASLRNWMQQTLEGKVSRRNMSVVLLNTEGQETVRFNLRNAWPVKWRGPELNAESGDVAIESLEITHEELLFVS